MTSKRLMALIYLSIFAMTGLAEAQYQKPTLEQASRVSLGQGLNGGDLERMKVGHQAGILKILSESDKVLFLKGEGTAAGAGVDSRELAPLSPADRDKIVGVLQITDPNAMARSLLNNYNRVSREHALALLGALAHPGEETSPLKPHLREEVLQFIRSRLQPKEDNKVRRQAVLALAVQPQTDAQMVQAMLNFLRRDHNAWNTFGVVQFFENHRDQIRDLPEFQAYLVQVQKSGSPHSEQISALLEREQ